MFLVRLALPSLELTNAKEKLHYATKQIFKGWF